MDSIEITGEIVRIKDKQTFASGFEKQEVIIRHLDGKYPQDYALEFAKDRTKDAGLLNVGDAGTFSCNLRGREWEGHDKWFVSLTCWKHEIDDPAPVEPEPSQHQQSKQDGYAPTPDPDDVNDDIPF